MATVAELVKAFNKDYGENTIYAADKTISYDRIPTGVFALDLSMGGGFPRGKVNIVYGPESSGKTNVVLRAIANHQRMWPDEVCAFVDAENAFDPKWAEKMGVNIGKLMLLSAPYAEQAVNTIEELLCAEDVGMVVLDSVAALMTVNEAESSAEKAVVGGNALVVGKLTRKVMMAQANAKREGRTPTFIAINQIRLKIGVMYGDPETMPGGKPLPFASSMTLRLYGKNIVDKKISPDMPVRKSSSAIIKKNKVPITATHCEFEMAMIPHAGLAVGECKDANTLTAFLKEYGWLGKSGSKWVLFDDTYPTLTAAIKHVYEDPMLLQEVRHKVIQRAIEVSQGGYNG